MQSTVIFTYIYSLRPLFLFLSLETEQQSPWATTANTRQLLIYHSLNRWNSVQPSILNTRARILSVSINHKARMTEREREKSSVFPAAFSGASRCNLIHRHRSTYNLARGIEICHQLWQEVSARYSHRIKYKQIHIYAYYYSEQLKGMIAVISNINKRMSLRSLKDLNSTSFSVFY